MISAQTNCPNCGAPIKSVKCEYCGTVFLDLQDSRSPRTFLELQNEYLKKQMDVQKLYDQALITMRSYDNGMMTANEVRELIGLDPLLKETKI